MYPGAIFLFDEREDSRDIPNSLLVQRPILCMVLSVIICAWRRLTTLYILLMDYGTSNERAIPS